MSANKSLKTTQKLLHNGGHAPSSCQVEQAAFIRLDTPPLPLSAAQRADNWARKCSRTTVLLITFCINLHSFPDVVLWRCLIQLDTKWKTNWAATPAGKMLVVVEKEYQAANKKAI